MGRERELGELSAALAAAVSGRGSLCLIAGERGAGKTMLAEQLCARAREQGVPVARGPCWESGGAPAYWPWIQVLRALAREPERGGAAPPALGRGGADVVALVPELAGRVAVDAAAAPAGDPEQRRFELFDAVVAYVLAAAAPAGGVVVLEDLHAADEGSLLLLSFLARQLHNAPLLVVGTHVDVGVAPGPAIERRLDALGADARRVRLDGLGDEHVAAMIVARTGAPADPALVDSVRRTTAGNPFFVDEIVRVLAGEGRPAAAPERLPLPDSVRSALARRLQPLDGPTRALLEAAAIVGGRFAVALLAACAEVEPAAALALLEPAERLHVVRPETDAPGVYAFAHQLVRETLLRELGAARRSELHDRVVTAIEQRHAGALDDQLAALAFHSMQALPAGGARRARGYARRAGELAARQLAYEDAAGWFRQALDVLDSAPAERAERCELLLALGSAQRRAGAVAAARASCAEAAALARALARPRLLAQAGLGFAGALGGPGLAESSDPAVVALLEEALDAVGAEPTPERAQLLARLALELYYSPAVERRRALSREAVEVAAATGDTRTRLIALYSRNRSSLGPDGLDARRRAADDLLELAAGSEDLEMRFSAHHFRLANHLERGDLTGADSELGALRGLGDTLHQPFYRWQLGLLQAMRALLQGRAQEGERLALAAFEAGRVIDEATAANLLAAQLFNHRWIVGRLGELADAIDVHADQRPWMPGWRCAAAFLRSEIGQEEEARRRLDAAGAGGFADLPRDGNWMTAILLAGLAASAIGARDHAAALYELALPVADRVVVLAGADTVLGPMALAAGALAATLGRWEEAFGHFATADRVAARMDARALAGLALRERARMLVARGEEGDAAAAAQVCGRALATAQALGMAGLEAQARALLAGLPDAPAAAHAPAPAGATASAPASAPGPGEPRAAQGASRVAVFERAGDAWRVGCEPDTTLLRHSKGMGQLARLLAAPGRAFSAVELLGRAGPAGDAAHAERARLNVTRSLRGAVRRVAEHDAVLGRELDASIRTGSSPRYDPPPRGATQWRVSP